MSTMVAPTHRREFLKATAQSATALALLGGNWSRADEVRRPSRISYYKNGEIFVGTPGAPEGKPLTTGHVDFKPSWSKTGDLLVCFRRLVDDPETQKWKTAIFIMGADGSGFHTLSDGTRTDFNPTWSRDGSNTPVWSRKNDTTGGYYVMRSKVGGKPGEEVALTDARLHTWAHSCLVDGRILVNSAHPQYGFGVFLLSAGKDGAARYERVECELTSRGQLHRASISPDEKRICFEFLPGAKFQEPGHTLYHADFDAQRRTITNLKAFANAAGKQQWFAYPRWINGTSEIVFHSSESGKNQLYVHLLDDGSTKRVSTDAGADYRYPHGEAAPC